MSAEWQSEFTVSQNQEENSYPTCKVNIKKKCCEECCAVKTTLKNNKIKSLVNYYNIQLPVIN